MTTHHDDDRDPNAESPEPAGPAWQDAETVLDDPDAAPDPEPEGPDADPEPDGPVAGDELPVAKEARITAELLEQERRANRPAL